MDAEKNALLAVVSNREKNLAVSETLALLATQAKAGSSGSPDSAIDGEKYAFEYQRRQEIEVRHLMNLNDRKGPEFVYDYSRQLLAGKRWLRLN